MQTLWELIEDEAFAAVLKAPGEPVFAPLPELLAGRTHAVVDLGEHALSPGAAAELSQVHQTLRARGTSLAYAAGVPATRGLCVVAFHQAQDRDTKVLIDRALAARTLAKGGSRLGDALAAMGVPELETTPGREASFIERGLARGMGWGMRMSAGYEAPFLETMLTTYGVAGATGELSRSLQRALTRLEEMVGDWQAQLLAGLTAFGNGCGFCAPGHMYAANLLYFEATGELLPLDEREARGWLSLSERWVRAQVLDSLQDAGHPELRQMAQRVFELRAGATPVDALDCALQTAHHAWTLVNECSLQNDPGPIQAIHPRVGRARRLQREYRLARERLALQAA